MHVAAHGVGVEIPLPVLLLDLLAPLHDVHKVLVQHHRSMSSTELERIELRLLVPSLSRSRPVPAVESPPHLDCLVLLLTIVVNLRREDVDDMLSIVHCEREMMAVVISVCLHPTSVVG